MSGGWATNDPGLVLNVILPVRCSAELEAVSHLWQAAIPRPAHEPQSGSSAILKANLLIDGA